MSFTSWLSSLASTCRPIRTGARRTSAPLRVRPLLERLEDREVLTAVIDIFNGSVPLAFPTNNSLINTRTPTLSGRGNSNQTLTISRNGTDLARTVIVDAGGQWTFTFQPGEELPNGTFTLAARDNQPQDDGGRINVAVNVPNTPNQPPVLTAPTTVGGTLQSGYVFPSSGPFAIRVTDPDSAANPLKITLTTDPGSPDNEKGDITLGSFNGVNVIENTFGRLVFTASQANAANALSGLTYTPQPGGPATGQLTVLVEDQGFLGSGGNKTATSTITINLQDETTGPNDAPVITAPTTVQGNATVVFPTSGAASIGVADPDAGNSVLLFTLTADTGSGQRGTITLGSTTGLTNINGDGTNTVSFQATQANAANAFNGLRYSLASGALNGKITVAVDDLGSNGTGGSRTATRDINVTRRSNQAPTPTPSLFSKKVGKKKVLFIRVGNMEIRCPFQKSAGFKAIRVSVDANGNVVITAKKGKRTITRTLTV